MNKALLLASEGGVNHAFKPLPVTSLSDPFEALCGAELPIRVSVKPLYKDSAVDITCPTCFAKYKPSGEEPNRPAKFWPNSKRKNSGPAVQGNLF
jgi:hypothetical protein